MKKYIYFIILFFLLLINGVTAQTNDISTNSNWTYHFQMTVVSQKHTAFNAAYSGQNSLADTVEPIATSITSTLFIGRKLWKGAVFYFNPEMAGGNGLSYSVGVAGALNGETYRIGIPEPQACVARAYLQQTFPLKNTSYENVDDDVNQVKEKIPTSRITITAGKFAISDFYDNNKYSHDPRNQFLNWSIMSNGAWDYPANTRGYTTGLITELIKPTWAVRISTVAVPRIANAPEMEYNIAKAHSETLEAEKKLNIKKRKGTVRFIVTNTYSRAPSYQSGIVAIAKEDTALLNVIDGKAENKTYGGHKLGLALNYEQELTNDLGLFSRVGWNDGKYATWAFTEIDQTASIGFSLKGNRWKRADDVFGIAGVVNGISQDHRTFLKDGGYGFIIGDGNLNYGHEAILETFYNARVTKTLFLTLDYQFVNNPAYNKDRGPVSVFAVRAHVEF